MRHKDEEKSMGKLVEITEFKEEMQEKQHDDNLKKMRSKFVSDTMDPFDAHNLRDLSEDNAVRILKCSVNQLKLRYSRDAAPSEHAGDDNKVPASTVLPDFNDSNDHKHRNDNVYTEGIRFWYWDRATRPRGAIMVSRHHNDLKEEMVSGGHITMEQWTKFYNDCERLCGTEKVRKIKARRISTNDIGHSIYGIPSGTAFASASDIQSIRWLLALKLYTDFQQLNHKFCEQFRFPAKGGNIEGRLQILKKRNEQYWHMAKLLTECVQCFGKFLKYCRGKKRKTQYYRGLKRPFMFSRFICQFHTPLSTSKSVC